MISFRYGGKAGRRFNLAISDELVAVRTHPQAPVTRVMPYEVTPLSNKTRGLLDEFEPVARYSDAGVEVLRARAPRGARALRDQARRLLKKEPMVRFAGRVLTDPASKAPVLYSENLFVKFDDDAKSALCHRTLRRRGLEIKQELKYARNAYFVGPTPGPDGRFHLAWVWRDSPDAETNHDLSYARSRDLVLWERSDGTPLKLPITLASAEIVDGVPVRGGMINNNTVTGFDANGRPVITYHKFDERGDTQVYLARRDAKRRARAVTHSRNGAASAGISVDADP